MFHMPMSSPMMKRMFGFLPFFSALATAAFTFLSAMASSWALLAPSEQQAGVSPAWAPPDFSMVEEPPVEVAWAFWNGLNLPVPAAYPSSAPTARMRTAWTLELRSIDPPSLQNRAMMPLKLHCCSEHGLSNPSSQRRV